MATLLDFIGLKRKTKNGLSLRKTATGEWAVQKGYTTLYIGSKEKCKYFMNQGQFNYS